MSNGFSVNVGTQKITIKVGDNIEDIKNKFGENAGTIFNDIDTNSDGKLDANEIDGLKTNIENADFEIEEDENDNTPVHGNTSARAYNTAIQNLKNKYNTETLTGFFKSDDSDLHTIKQGDTLYKIAKKALESEGLPTDYKSINNRIAEIANINNLRDINNVAIGTKLKINLTDAGVAKVKENSNDSVKAFTGQARTDEAGEDWTNIAKRRSTASQKTDQTNETAETTTVAKAPTSDKTSTITPTRNGLNMGSGMPVDENGEELTDTNGKRDFTNAKFKKGGGIMKYQKGDKVMFQTVYPENGRINSGVALSAPRIDKLKDLKAKFETAYMKLNAIKDEDNDATKASKRQANLAALKELVEITNGNTQVIKNVSAFLKKDTWVDRDSKDYKAFVQDLILTRNADVVRALTTDKGGNVDMSIVEKDKAGHETLAGLYQEIRNKEKAGVKLTAEEVDLKDALVRVRAWTGYKIEANTNNKVHEKYMAFYNNNGNVMYQVRIDNNWYFASDEKLLDEFLTKLEAANDDTKKTALFKEYANTKDTELARCLLRNVKTLKASDDDIKAIIQNNSIEVIDSLWLKNGDNEIEYSKDVIDAMVARYKKIYTVQDKGNLENAEFLEKAADWIDRSDMSDEDKTKAKAELAETYFKKTTTADNKVEYTFNPSRRPTKEEMAGLAYIADDAMKVALVNYEKYEDMGKGQYSEGIGEKIDSKELIAHRAAMVENMSSADDVIDFINNKVTVDKPWDIPFDKIMEKFGNDKKVLDALLKATNYKNYKGVSDDAINNDNRIKLLNTYIKNGKVDKSALPQGYDAKQLIRVLPNDCKQDPAKSTFVAVLKEYGHNDVKAFTVDFHTAKNPDAVKARLRELVKTAYNKQNHTVQYDFINAVCALPADIRPKAELAQLLKDMPKLGTVTKANVFKAVNGYSKKGFETGTKLVNTADNKARADILRDNGDIKEITPENVTGIIKAFENSTSIMNGLTRAPLGGRPGMALCNRIPKALMKKAIAMGLTNTDAYKNLEKFYGSNYDEDKKTLTFTKNDDAKKVYEHNVATEADKLIRALAEEIIENS